jgi:16S rRNA (adenine1518-N6/adenine1519-N6)-dimethyltransferase
MAVRTFRRRLGQHFLIDRNIVRKMVAVAAIQPHETVLEIGPGRGILTQALCEQARHVLAIELDRSLGPVLEAALATCPNVEIHFQDALRFPFATVPSGTVVVANLPYSVSSPLLFRLLDVHDRFDRIVVMLQTEVARRLVAPPGTKDYGVLSVLTQYRASPSLAFSVSPECFRPRPSVQSTVVVLKIRREPLVSVVDEALFIRVVRAAFAHRRKTLYNSLRDEGFLAAEVAHAMAAAGLRPLSRAEALTLGEFATLANELARSGRPTRSCGSA